MEIRINDHKAELTIEHEKTVGEVLAGLEQWITDCGHRLSGLAINGQAAGISSLDDAFSREINTIKTLDISTSPLVELAVISLLNLLGDLEEYDTMAFDCRGDFLRDWKQRPQAMFAGEQMPDIYAGYVNYFSGSGPAANVLCSITEERIRELKSPIDEFTSLKPHLDETCNRLINLPLDIQTGKDGYAAMTIQLFSGIAEKIIRIFRELSVQGYLKQDNPVSGLIIDFNESAKELLQAFEANDTVLIGDLAEYEMAPRLVELYNTISSNTKEQEAEKK